MQGAEQKQFKKKKIPVTSEILFDALSSRTDQLFNIKSIVRKMKR